MRSPELRGVARARFQASAEVPTAFFEAHAERVALACRDLARGFHAGGRLLVCGCGAQHSDALHLAVEFVHPVIVGKRALPVLALGERPAEQLRVVGEPGDMVIGLVATADPGAVGAALATARSMGLRTLALVGAATGEVTADHHFRVPSADPFVVQEVHETLYHVLWELVHVFLEHPGTLR